MSETFSLPIACTLTSDGLRERLGEIRALTRAALQSYERDGLTLRLHYAPEAAGRVRAVVVAEQRCCGFLTFDLREDADAVHLTVTAPERARDAADELFAQFVPAASVHTDL